MKKNLRIQLEGGIGNQLFQLAAVLHYANLHEMNYSLLRAEKYDSKFYHLNGLENLKGLHLIPRNLFLRGRVGSWIWRIDRHLLKKFVKYRKARRIFVFTETDIPRYLPNKTREIRGYFHTPTFPLEHSTFIRKTLRKSEGTEFKSYLNDFDGENKISVHMRRGDYLKLGSKYGELGKEYYLPAIKKITDFLNRSELLIFSDDIAYAKKFFSAVEFKNFNIAYAPATLKPFENITLMSYCTGHIISNSTFSWWGAVLAENSKMVIAPSRWSKDNSIPPNLNLRPWHIIDPKFI